VHNRGAEQRGLVRIRIIAQAARCVRDKERGTAEELLYGRFLEVAVVLEREVDRVDVVLAQEADLPDAAEGVASGVRC
jgi:hypothetical protein